MRVAVTMAAREALQAAEAQARQRGHGAWGEAHLAWALLHHEGARPLLEALGVPVAEARQQAVGLLSWQERRPAGVGRALPSLAEALALADEEAHRHGQRAIDVPHLVLALLRLPHGLLALALEPWGVSFERAAARSGRRTFFVPRGIPPVSTVFWALLVGTVGAGLMAWRGAGPIWLFAFVTGGWILSLCLHEFAHALVAFWGGDRSVVGQGYLTLNPLRYTHGVLSILFPVLILLMGGIGLPGGAVYIQMGAIRARGMRSLVSAAGPLATAACGLGLAALLWLGLALGALTEQTLGFWAGVTLLAFLQLTALFFNLLPIPGLDGFGILAPFLPARLLTQLTRLGGWTFFIILLLFFNDTPASRAFWATILLLADGLGLHRELVAIGFDLYQFWR